VETAGGVFRGVFPGFFAFQLWIAVRLN